LLGPTRLVFVANRRFAPVTVAYGCRRNCEGVFAR
jgi:hypothetical protein